MQTGFLQWLVSRWKRLFSSIAFYPAVIALFFLCLSVLMVFIDSSSIGKAIKSKWQLLRLQDASTARSIISAITAGIISLTVFSFSMVMVVLNQAASQMSNRVLDKLIGNRFQQIILGFYIGTIVYSLFLLSTIRDIDDGIYVPSLSTYLLILFTIADIFLFIYFLHYITQSVKYDIVIHRIHEETKKSLKHTCRLDKDPEVVESNNGALLMAPASGLFTSFNKEGLLSVLRKHNCRLSFLYPTGSFVLQHSPLLTLAGDGATSNEEWKDDLLMHVFLSLEESIGDDFQYGFRQLTEVAVKALSPGVNDPGTAIAGMRALADLLSYRLKHYPSNVIRDEKGIARIITKELSFEQLFTHALFPIWDYGKHDRMIQLEMRNILSQMLSIHQHAAISKLLVKVQRQIEEHETT